MRTSSSCLLQRYVESCDDAVAKQAEDGRVFPLQASSRLGLVLVELVEVWDDWHCNVLRPEQPHGPTVGQGEARIQLVERLQGEATPARRGCGTVSPGSSTTLSP